MIRPTAAGAWVLVVSAVLALMGWLLGIPELVALCIVALVGWLLGVVIVAVRRPSIGVERRIRPQRIADGMDCEVMLRVDNAAARTSPPLTLEDDAGVAGRVWFALAPLRPDESVTTVRQLHSLRRGVHHIGPITLTHEDPFGLIRRRSVIDERSTVIVVPRSEHLDALPLRAGDEPDSSRPSHVHNTVDEEFTSLREYSPGDDIRRIHWPSTARAGVPVVRQFEHPWHRRVTLLIDLRCDGDADAFERALVVAASVIDLAARHGETIRVMDSTGADSGSVPAGRERGILLERLAVLSPSASEGEHSTALTAAASAHRSGALVVVSPAADAASLAGHADQEPILVATNSARPERHDRNAILLRWDGDEPLSTVWSRAVAVGVTG